MISIDIIQHKLYYLNLRPIWTCEGPVPGGYEMLLVVAGLLALLVTLGLTDPHMRGQSWNPFGE
ncbi:MAG TPA: hypothetical protein VLA88_02535 [Candidatus Saccharimonadales bacterium]|nr:hypothetical protein [Candidatus Saccharimonadales bacterium]